MEASFAKRSKNFGVLLLAIPAMLWSSSAWAMTSDGSVKAFELAGAQTGRPVPMERPEGFRDPRPTHQRASARSSSTRSTTISEGEDRQMRLQKNEIFRQVKAYLDDHPEEVERFLDRSSYTEFRRAVAQDRIDQWIANQPEYEIRIGRDRFLLQPNYVDLIDLGHALEAARDTAHIQRLYERIYNLLPQSERGGLLVPQRLARLRHVQARSHLDQIIRAYARFFESLSFEPPELSEIWNTDCTAEIGATTDLGDGAARCEIDDFHQDSLFWNSYFHLKFQHTCIKHQGARGTCVAFAINSAVESKLFRETGKAYSLSQQKTYLLGLKRRSSPGRYRDGLPTGRVLEEFVSHETNIQFESVWRYNPSYSRYSLIDVQLPFFYPDSCLGYAGPMCTWLAFQGIEELECIGGSPQQTCQRIYEYPAGNTDAGAVISDVTRIRLPGMSTAEALDVAIGLLSGGSAEPLIVSYAVLESFRMATSNGRVKWVEPAEDEDIGSHASVLIGFVPNSQLPEGVPEAAERGYFILKNSWGIGNGDCGYYYLDYEYLRNTLRHLFAIDL